MQETELLVRYNLFFFLFFPIVIYAQSYPIAKVDYLARKGLSNLYNNNFSEAENIFGKLNNDYPNIPFGKILLVLTEFSKSSDFVKPLNEKRINMLLKIARQQSDSLLGKNDNNVWNNYFAALTVGLTAYNNYLMRDYFNALTNSLTSLSSFQKCLEIDSTFYDAYIAIGMFKYWLSANAKALNWLPFVQDKRIEGIKYLTKGIRAKSYLYPIGIESLVWIYIHEKKFQKAKEIAQKGLNKYPKSRIFLYGLAHAYTGINRGKAIVVLEKILKSYRDDGIKNIYYQIELKHKIAMHYEFLGKYRKALELCNQILSIKDINSYVLTKLGNRLERVKKLRKKLLKILTGK